MMAVLIVGVYSLLIVTGSLLGGMIPSRFSISHLGMQIILSFVGGLMLGISLLHLLPHSLEHMTHSQQIVTSVDSSIKSDQETHTDEASKVVTAEQLDAAVADAQTTMSKKFARSIAYTFMSAMAGLLGMFYLIRLFHFHQHGPVATDDHDCSHHDHGHHHLSWGGVAFGLSVHSLLDGVALGTAVLADARHSATATGLAGFGVFLAVALHKPLDALSITSLMQSSRWSRSSQQAVNAGFAAMCPVGALAVMIAGQSALLESHIDTLVGIALGVSGGVFLCISLSDLLPEVQFHSHDRLKLSGALLLGVAGAYAIGFLEPSHYQYM
ncbi:MAG: ZIP family metal transporter [Planctomycetales bacterium]|nr:ZIP family metal transporter [Planctomycetales bacterium]